MSDNAILNKLKFARNLLKKRGWAQTWEEGDGRICAVASIRLASGAATGDYATSDAEPAVQFLSSKLHEKTGGEYSEIPAWNDSSNRTFEDVLALFDEAIAELEA